MEILRHHRTKRHLRRDQRWRYEHLRSVDPVTNKLQHRVRGRNGKLLTKIELARELPKFIHAELVDTDERFPFYHDFTEGRTTALVTPESRAKTSGSSAILFNAKETFPSFEVYGPASALSQIIKPASVTLIGETRE